MLKKPAGRFKSEGKEVKTEATDDEDPLRPIVVQFGRLERNSLCDICLKNDFTALFRNPGKYEVQSAGYSCANRTVAHILEQKEKLACIFCMLTYCCLGTLRLENVPNSGTFTVSSHAFTAGVGVNDSEVGSEDEMSLSQSGTSPGQISNADHRYVRIVFRVCEIANERDLYYFTERDMGGGRMMIEMRVRDCYDKLTTISLQPWIEPDELSPPISLSDPRLFLTGRPYAKQVRFDLIHD
jgi:hypothetical protein